MNKTKLKEFAINSRKALIEQIDFKIKWLDPQGTYKTEEVGDKIIYKKNEKKFFELSKKQSQSRLELKRTIENIGYEQTLEEVAYIWFNRLVAIRYMEINKFLPLGINNETIDVRILSNRNKENPNPEIIERSNLYNKQIDLQLDYNEIEKNNEKYQEIYSYVLTKVCQKLGQVIPQIFDTTASYIDLLIPNNLLAQNSILRKLTNINLISEDEWKEEVEIIGWIYQYYISEKKDEIFTDLKNNIKISKDKLPAATQLFTPDWIVKYLVQNSLGKIWTEINEKENNEKSKDMQLKDKKNKTIETEEQDNLKKSWQYYIEDKNEKSITTNINKKITEISIIDPCMGSGHILVYVFRILMQMYKTLGYKEKDIPSIILENNIHGLDIDDRAGQLAYFALLMEARKYDQTILKKPIKINVLSIQESNNISEEILEIIRNKGFDDIIDYVIQTFKNAKEYGSLITTEKKDYNQVLNYIEILKKQELDIIEQSKLKTIEKDFIPLIKQAQMLSSQYDAVITNPPYMGKKNINTKLNNYLSKNYPITKTEMYAAFIERCNKFTAQNGYQAMITIHSWMFISSFEELRKTIIQNNTIINMLHTGPATFPELNAFNVLATAFCLKKQKINNYKTTFIRLVDYHNPEEKIKNYNNLRNYYYINQDEFTKIPGSPYIYWISDKIRKVFKENITLEKYYPPKQGLATSDNNKFVRLWQEIDIQKIGFNCKTSNEAIETGKKWFPYNKGGDYRKWYGNNEYVVNWEKDGYEIKNCVDENNKLRSRPQNIQFYFKKGITWSLFGFENFGVRYKDYGFIFDVSGSSMFPDDEYIYYIIGYLCSKVAFKFLSLLAPTVNFQVGNIASLPFKDCKDKQQINQLVKQNIEICKQEWDSNETSWDFKEHPLVNKKIKENTISKTIENYKDIYNAMRNKLRENEITLNKEYAKIFDVENEIDVNVNDRDLSIKEFEEKKLIKSFLSYMVGCLLGRYSLDKQGLIFAGGKYNKKECISTFEIDEDGIILLTDEQYFENDIITKLCEFLKVIYGTETLEENLEYIAKVLGKKGKETARETIRNYFSNEFFKDHCKTYQKRPIYWMLESGKNNGFKCLIYIHRYTKDLIEKIKKDYLYNLQKKYESLIENIDIRLNETTKLSEKKQQEKQKQKYIKQLNETIKYNEKIKQLASKNIEIDLDDGIKENYEKFKDILAKIK